MPISWKKSSGGQSIPAMPKSFEEASFKEIAVTKNSSRLCTDFRFQV